jgi:hypothetical protein
VALPVRKRWDFLLGYAPVFGALKIIEVESQRGVRVVIAT